MGRVARCEHWLIPAVAAFIIASVVGCGEMPTKRPAISSPTTLAVSTSPDGTYRDFIYGGLPKSPQKLTLLRNKGYLVGYSENHKDPVWVAYRLGRVDHPALLPRPTKFSVDDRTVSRVRSDDYAKTGYDRGHMAPNHAIATRFGEQAQLETFLMSNVCPQTPDLNRKAWERLEATEADVYANRFEEIWVIDGPIFDDQPDKLSTGVDVPRAFFKIIVDEVAGKPRILAFIMPQAVKASVSPKAFLTSVEEIEKETGLMFFTELPSEEIRKLEEKTAKRMW